MTERRIVVLAFFAFLAVGAVVILVAAQPSSSPSIHSALGVTTTEPHRAATSSTTPGTLPRVATEVKGESATSGTAPTASGPKPTVTTTRRAGATSLFGILAAPTVTSAAPPPSVVITKPAPATATSPPATTKTTPPTTAPPTTAPPTTAPPTTAPPTTAPPITLPPITLPPIF